MTYFPIILGILALIVFILTEEGAIEGCLYYIVCVGLTMFILLVPMNCQNPVTDREGANQTSRKHEYQKSWVEKQAEEDFYNAITEIPAE